METLRGRKAGIQQVGFEKSWTDALQTILGGGDPLYVL